MQYKCKKGHTAGSGLNKSSRPGRAAATCIQQYYCCCIRDKSADINLLHTAVVAMILLHVYSFLHSYVCQPAVLVGTTTKIPTTKPMPTPCLAAACTHRIDEAADLRCRYQDLHAPHHSLPHLRLLLPLLGDAGATPSQPHDTTSPCGSSTSWWLSSPISPAPIAARAHQPQQRSGSWAATCCVPAMALTVVVVVGWRYNNMIAGSALPLSSSGLPQI